jgi:hypothetical protein
MYILAFPLGRRNYNVKSEFFSDSDLVSIHINNCFGYIKSKPEP